MTTSNTTTAKRFKVALSFAGENRSFVEAVATQLSMQLGASRVLYDKYYEEEFARTDLDTYLQALYHDDSELIAVFLCENYQNKEWCGLEWRALKDLIKRRRGADIMPLRFDNTEIPGLFSTDGYIWISERPPEEIAQLILKRLGITKPTDCTPNTPNLYFNEGFPRGTIKLFGREDELDTLDAAWASLTANDPANPPTNLLELIAPGGVGKSALVREWLTRLRGVNWGGARRVYGWSFYSQGSDAKRQASEDQFLEEALRWFGIDPQALTNAADKGRRLGQAVTAVPTLLVLDGLEPLQHPPGPLAGKLRAPGLTALFDHLAGHPSQSLCLITSREAVTDLDDNQRNDSRLTGCARRVSLHTLQPVAGARLLHEKGARRAGEATIEPDDEELIKASQRVHGHALTLSLLGSYLRDAYGGDIRHAAEIDFAEADREQLDGHAFKVIAAYEVWFAREGEKGARQLAALRLLGFFDRPASPECLAALRAAPTIPGLTEALVNLSAAQWRSTLSNLEQLGLVFPPTDPKQADQSSLDAHPLIREYLAAKLQRDLPEAWREGHRRLYEYLKGSVPHRPDDLDGLQPLFQAVAHGCSAGLWREACYEVYLDRILRGDEAYSTKKLGAFGAELSALAGFFVEPWARPQAVFDEGEQAWLLGEAGFDLRALGRLAEAEAPLRAGGELRVRQEKWKNAAIAYGNLSELRLTLGLVAAAVAAGEKSLGYARRSGDAFQHISKLSTLADALHQQGEADVLMHFAEAEDLQRQRQPDYPLLYSLRGFQYCEVLLGTAERAAWASWLADKRDEGQAAVSSALTVATAEVAQRAAQTLAWITPHNVLLDIGLDHLTLARYALYQTLLSGNDAGPAESSSTIAVTKLREAGQQDYLPRGLLTRAWLYRLQGKTADARADLAAVERIARRGGMKLHLADLHLTRARLFFREDRDLALADLKDARKLIEECGYGRRLPELADAEAVIGVLA